MNISLARATVSLWPLALMRARRHSLKGTVLTLILLLPLINACATPLFSRSTIAATDAKGIRKLDGNKPLLVNYLSIKQGTEDRVVLSFDVSKFKGADQALALELAIKDFDADGAPGMIDVYAFNGQPKVKPDDFDAGTRIAQARAPGSGTVRVGVTDAVRRAVNQGEHYIDFRLSTETEDRYFLGDIVDLPAPVLRYVPGR